MSSATTTTTTLSLEELERQIQTRIDQIQILQHQVDELKIQALETLSESSELDKVLTAHSSSLYTQRPTDSFGYGTLTVLSLIVPIKKRHLTHALYVRQQKALSKQRALVKQKYPSMALPGDLIVFIGDVQFSEKEKTVLKKHGITYRFVSGFSTGH